MKIYKVCIFLSLVLCDAMGHAVRHFNNSETINDTVSWYATGPVTEYPALSYQISLKITFPQELCCPILIIFSNLENRIDHVEDFYLGEGNCLENVTREGRLFWFKSTTFMLPNNTQGRGNCYLDKGMYTCNINTDILIYEPKYRWITLGYSCNQVKNLTGLRYEYKGTVRNTTECERMEIPENTEKLYFQCNDFYNYIAFPNLFGHKTQVEAFAILQVFETAIKNMDTSCHKHLNYILCQAFLPRCPEEVNENNKTTSYLAVICQEMCWEAVKACEVTLQPVIDFIDCSYYIRSSEIPCTYKDITCDAPPDVKNGQLISSEKPNYKYQVGSSLGYTCDNDYKAKGNTTFVCGYSGKWSGHLICENRVHIKIIILGVTCLICFLLIATLSAYAFKKHRDSVRRAKYYENQPRQKRSKENDAFISFAGDHGPDYSFVRNSVQPKLEQQSSPPFKLTIHLRDFRADTLIYVNIRNAVRDSNCAIILMSQAYIDSRWCREEFEECVEEQSKDSAYKLFVIMMQPQESLRRYTAYMDKYFRSKTYLQKEDPQLWTKIRKYLRGVKTNPN